MKRPAWPKQDGGPVGPPHPGRVQPTPSPPVPTPIHRIQAYLLPELPSQAQFGGGTATSAPRSGEATLSPRPAPGRRRREGGARAAPGNRPSASEGLRDGWEAEPARRFARVEPAWDVGKKKKERKRLGSKKRQGKHYQASKRHRKSRVCPVPQKTEATSGLQISRQSAGSASLVDTPPWRDVGPEAFGEINKSVLQICTLPENPGEETRNPGEQKLPLLKWI